MGKPSLSASSFCLFMPSLSLVIGESLHEWVAPWFVAQGERL